MPRPTMKAVRSSPPKANIQQEQLPGLPPLPDPVPAAESETPPNLASAADEVKPDVMSKPGSDEASGSPETTSASLTATGAEATKNVDDGNDTSTAGAEAAKNLDDGNDTPKQKGKRRRRTNWEGALPSEMIRNSAPWFKKSKRDDKLRFGPALKVASKGLREARNRLEVSQVDLKDARAALEEAQARLVRAEQAVERDKEAVREAEEKTIEAELEEPSKWSENYHRLVEYKAQHGTLRVSNRIDKNLNQWVKGQKVTYQKYLLGKQGTTRPQRMVALEKLGLFVGKWDEKFDEMMDFKARTGHCNVPQNWKENKKLGTWVGLQRHEHKKWTEGKANQLTEDRIKKLEDAGFVWKIFHRPKKDA